MLNPKSSARHLIRPGVNSLYQLIFEVLLRDPRHFHMAAPEQSNLVGLQHQRTGFIGEQHGFCIDPILVIIGGGDKLLERSYTLGD